MGFLLLRLFFGDLPELLEAFYRPNSASWKLFIGIALAIVMGFSAYHTLPRHFPQLAAKQTKPGVVQARTNAVPLTNAIALTNSVAPSPSPVPTSHGVKLGDTVQISAIHPPVSMRSAVITAIDDTQLTVCGTGGSYTILWKDLTGLKAASAPAVKSTR